MSAAWIVLGIGVAIAMLMLRASLRRRAQEVDLGSVSHQWIAEQRLDHGYDSRR